MILSKRYLRHLIRKGKADYCGKIERRSLVLTGSAEGTVYVAVDRYDKQRVDHYELEKDAFK